MKIVARETPNTSASLLKAVALRGVLATLFWLVLTEGSADYWGLAVLVVALTTLTSLVFVPVASWRWRPMGLLRFLPYFAMQSLRGGIDVSRRAFHPRAPLDPGYVEHQFRLPEGPLRVFFVNAINLQPGTVGVRIEGDRLRVHALDQSMPVEENLRDLEERVAGLFGVELGP
ncbi:hypothetical protein BH23CHL1_BH23CHL1_22100 [soil metagenome]